MLISSPSQTRALELMILEDIDCNDHQCNAHHPSVKLDQGACSMPAPCIAHAFAYPAAYSPTERQRKRVLQHLPKYEHNNKKKSQSSHNGLPPTSCLVRATCMPGKV